jgi:hypothetical protein
MQSAADHVKPVYRQLKSVVPFTPLEMGIGGALQTIQDLDNDLDPAQRILRSGIVGVEIGLTDIVSSGYGAGGYFYAGVPGYVALAFAANLTADQTWDNLNTQVFPLINLGKYP